MYKGVYRSVQALYCVANATLEKLREANFHTPDILKHQNTKTSLYEVFKNHWVFALFEFFWVCQKKITIYSL